MTKLFGLVLIALSVTAFGEKYISFMKTRIKSISAMSAMMTSLGEKICDFKMSGSEFFASYKNAHLESVNFTEYVRTKGFVGALDICKDDLCLEEGEMRVLCEFGEKFGSESTQNEVKKCEHFSKKLAEIEKSALSDFDAKVKLLRMSGIFCAVTAAILFI